MRIGLERPRAVRTDVASSCGEPIATPKRESMVESQREYEPALDRGIEQAVKVLSEGGVETFESCEGGPGHCFPEPTVRFYGDHSEGFRALSFALQRGLPVRELRRYWSIIDGEPTGPHWEMTLARSPS